jgi:hypothetical protein
LPEALPSAPDGAHVTEIPMNAELAALLLGQIHGSGSAAGAGPARTEPAPRGKALSPWISVLSLGKDDRDA